MNVVEAENWKARIRKENEAQKNFQNWWNLRSAIIQNGGHISLSGESVTSFDVRSSKCGSSSCKSSKTGCSCSSRVSRDSLQRALDNERTKVQQLEAYIEHMQTCPYGSSKNSKAHL